MQKNRYSDLSNWIPFFALLAVMLIITIVDVNFASLPNIMTILRQSSILLVAALGQMFVVQIGSIDLSVIGTMGLTSVITSFFVANAQTDIAIGFWAIPIALAVAALIGFANGIIHTKLRIPAFMTTLGMNFICVGIAVVLYVGRPNRISDMQFRTIATGMIGDTVPIIVIIAMAIFAVTLFVFKYLRFGRLLLAIGGDEEKTQLRGIDTKHYKLMAFVCAGVLFGIAGILVTAREGVGTAALDATMTLRTVAALAIGGIPLSGGRKSPWAVIIGVMMLGVLNNGMIRLSIDSNMQDAIVGAITIAAAMVSVKRTRFAIIK